MRNITPATWLILCGAVCLVVLAYWPGLHGGFLFDDFANLPALGETGPITRWDTFWRYLTSGTADPTGRPIALLSFLLDAHDWPASPYPFKRTNLLIHVLNGVVLFLLLRRLGRVLEAPPRQDRRRLDAAAALGAGLWMAHPLFVSTTLYIVQREAMLPVLFTLLGLLLWLGGRRAFGQGRAVRGALLTALGLGGCTLLATLSKANGVLIPALALTIECCLLRPLTPVDDRRETLPRSYRGIMIVLAGIPTALVAAYLLYRGWQGLAHGISSARPWTLAQRLLTEPRVLLDYLQLLWLPTAFTPGLFNEHLMPSTGLWSPPGTLMSLLAIAALLGAGIALRKRLPAVATAIVFFFVGQSIESSTVPLELYFEHRNYLPALLMFWPVALWLCDVPQGVHRAAVPKAPKSMSPSTRRKAKAGLAVVLLVGLAGMTHARATLWGNAHDQALVWARLNPSSPRAQANAAQAEIRAGHPARAIARLQPALAQAPDQVQLAFNLLAAECQTGHIQDSTLEAAERALRTSRNTGTLLEHWFERAMNKHTRPPCPEMNPATLRNLLAAARANPKLMSSPGRRQDIYHLQGSLALSQGRPGKALSDFNLALDQQVRATAALKQAAQLGAAGYPSRALAHLDHYAAVRGHKKAHGYGMPRVHAWVLERQDYWDRELARLRTTLLADERSKGQSSE